MSHAQDRSSWLDIPILCAAVRLLYSKFSYHVIQLTPEAERDAQ